jgi:hypothetical protein
MGKRVTTGNFPNAMRLQNPAYFSATRSKIQYARTIEPIQVSFEQGFDFREMGIYIIVAEFPVILFRSEGVV